VELSFQEQKDKVRHALRDAANEQQNKKIKSFQDQQNQIQDFFEQCSLLERRDDVYYNNYNYALPTTTVDSLRTLEQLSNVQVINTLLQLANLQNQMFNNGNDSW
jgi:hypothetical protein